MIRAFLIAVTLFALTAAAVCYIGLTTLVSIKGPLQDDTIVYIAPGTSTRDMGHQLTLSGAVDAPWVFQAAALLVRGKGPLQAGEYKLPRDASAADIVALLQSGKTYARSLTVPEGLMSVEIVALINAAEGLEGEITTIPADGTLLPETYHYQRGDKREELLARMQSAMTKAVATLWPTRSEKSTVHTPEEALILASIVEKETGVAAERPRVAGVFANRMNAGMPLQSDPTVIYAVTQGKYTLERPLSRADLAMSSPYNTYTNKGLPPGPIANPGIASIKAVLAPEEHGYFYFVADGTGGHAFSSTLAEHNTNVARWRTRKN